MTFRERHGLFDKAPDRDIDDDAPPRVRAFLHETLMEAFGAVDAYKMLCKQMGILQDGHVLSWGANDATPEVARMVEKLPWPDVYQMLEDVGGQSRPDLWAEQVNDVFARSGVAFEMNEDGEILVWDPEGDELGIIGEEREALDVLKDDLKPARKQYLRALRALHGRPGDPEKAVSEAVGALEAVAHIATGQKDFGRAIDSIFDDALGWQKALAESIKKLYGYASQLPGARHGRHEDSETEVQEALYAVRACGAAIAYVAYLHRIASD